LGNGGAIKLPQGAGFTISGFTIEGGTSEGFGSQGGGIRGFSSFTNEPLTSAVVENNILQDNFTYDWYGGGGVSLGINSIVRNNTFLHNSSRYGSGAVYVGAGSLVENNVFIENSASEPDSYRGAGAVEAHDASVIVRQNVFQQNSSGSGATGYGGGFSGTATVYDNLFLGNSTRGYNSGDGGAAYLTGGSFVNNTLVGNIGDSRGQASGVYAAEGTIVCNNIIVGGIDGVGIYSDGSITADFNNVWNNDLGSYGGSAVPGTHDIHLDPLFLGSSNYRLSAVSPCIDAGSNAVVPFKAFIDIDGNPRITDTVDMGAYETSEPAILITPTSGLVTTEAGGTATFTVKLKTQPTADVTIDLSSSNTTEGTVSPSSITFTPTDWNLDHVVTVTGVDDSAADGNVEYTIVTAAATSTAPDYNGLDAEDVSVTNNDDDPPSLSIGDVAISEGNRGTTTLTFTVSMSGLNPLGSSVNYATANGTATAGSDYASTSGTLTWAAGDTASQTISVTVNGDMVMESDETFYVDLSEASGATISKSQGVGTIENDDIWQDAVGLFSPSSSKFYLRNTNDAGYADKTFVYGPKDTNWKPIAGDWNTDGTGTIGLFNPITSVFYLRNTNDVGIADLTFKYGPAGAGWLPIAGDWDGDGRDTIGLYNPTKSIFYLRNTNDAGVADLTFQYGPANADWLPIVGDWDHDGKDTVGLYNPISAKFFLHNTNAVGAADLTFVYGPRNTSWKPIVGDWDADGTDTIGLYNPATAKIYERNTNDVGVADVTFVYGPANAGWTPIISDWNGPASPLRVEGGAIATDTACLSESALQPVVAEAIARWTAVGLQASSLSMLKNVNCVVADLPGSYLGLAETNAIFIDRTAAGHGWFVDPTPTDDREFHLHDTDGLMASENSLAVGRADLLTTVMHEMGHLLGYDHADDGLMIAILPLGARQTAAVDEVFAALHQM
jgi:hypothetical protein